MGIVVTVPFEITGWEPEPLSLGDGPVVFGRATVRKAFGGPLTGSSVAAVTTTMIGEAPAGYVAVELVTGALEGRTGTFVLQHTGEVDGGEQRTSGVVLPGTGTDGFVGLRGTVAFAHDQSGARLTLDYQLGSGVVS